MRNYFISLLLAFILLGVFVSPALAQISQNCQSAQGGYCVGLAQTYVPGLEFLKVPKTAEIGEFLTAVYYFLIGVVGLSAFIAFTVGGVMYLFSAGSEKMTSQGRVWMWNAVYGLAIAMISWLVLYTINPDLVLQLNLQIKPIRGTIQGQDISQKTFFRCSASGLQYLTPEQCDTECKKVGGSCIDKPPPTAGKWLCESSFEASDGKEFDTEDLCKKACVPGGTCTLLTD